MSDQKAVGSDRGDDRGRGKRKKAVERVGQGSGNNLSAGTKYLIT